MITAQEPKVIPNKNQQECIETIDGTVMVLAGPGTGKTFTVIQRIANMITKGIAPDSILCLTYSEAAATEMKTRLINEIGAVAAAVSINTYHAFCNEVIKNNPYDFELLEGVNLVDDITKRVLMSETIKEYKPKYHLTKWGDSQYFIPELLADVDLIKKSNITKEEYFYNLENHPRWQGTMDALTIEYQNREKEGKLVKSFIQSFKAHQKKMNKAREAWEIYECYSKKLQEKNFIDFNDMINLVVEGLSTNNELLKRVSKQYKYFLVDEYQDTNYSQNNIVFKLAEGSNSQNIFVVGDDDQIIYEFQGAKTDTLSKFLKRYPSTKVICLDENNRSTQTILDFSYELICQDKTRLEFNPEFSEYNIKKSLVAKNEGIIKNTRPINLYCFQEQTQESNQIISDIENLINSNDVPKNKKGEIDLSQIAIFARQNADLNIFADLLQSKNIPFQMRITKSIFDIKPSIILYFYLKALYNPAFYSDKLFGLLGAYPFDFEAQDYKFLLIQNRLNHKNFINNIRENLDNDWVNKEKVEKFIKTYDSLKSQIPTQNLRNLVITVCNETGILDYYINSESDRVENILAIKRMIDEASHLMQMKKGASLKDYIDTLDSAFESDVPILIDKDDYIQNAVQLLTYHGSKGRQFDYVFMPYLTSKRWEKKIIRNSCALPIVDEYDNIDNDERIKSENLRLLFVGATRAKYNLTLSYSNSYNGAVEQMSSYISDVVRKNEQWFDTKTFGLSKEDYIFELAKSYTKTKYDYKSSFKDELLARVKDIVLSPSSLNSYLKCPREFLYTHVLKIPVYEKSWDSANYGSAYHKTLENAVNYLMKNNKYPSLEQMLEDFRSNMEKYEFSTEEDKEIKLDNGLKTLSAYYPKFIETSADKIYALEYNFDLVPIGNNFIKGKIDRIEKCNDGRYMLYDYKTGSAKPKSQIAVGKGYENYLNQLRFYKVAFEAKNKGAIVDGAGLIFPEDYTKNVYINLTVQDDKEILENIEQSYKSIRNLEFSPIEHDDEKCKFCDYKQMCKLNLY